MRYTTDDNRENRIFGILATVVYLALWGLLIFFISFRFNVPENSGDGILVNFGDSETGLGDENLPASDELADAAEASQSAADAAEQDQLTQDFEDAPEVVPTTDPVTTPRPDQNRNQPTPAEEPVAQPREVDRRALFPGRSDSNSTSEGTAGGPGNQGNLAGDPSGDHTGTGTGTSGNSFSLDGRSLIGSLPVPEYNAREEGRVVIEIRVDPQGRVVSAAYLSVGSTTNNAVLVAAAQRAAMRARFNVDESSPANQIGKITYNFRMR